MERDRTDESRKDGPLVRPQGADIVDTSFIDIDDVIDRLEAVVRSRAGARLAEGQAASKSGGSRP